jgi:hypothetical protein
MQEQKGGRTRSEGKQISFKLSKNADDMLMEIQKHTGAETTAEAIRLIIFDFYKRNIKKNEEKF